MDKLKKVITDDGEIFYFLLKPNYIGWLEIHLYTIESKKKFWGGLEENYKEVVSEQITGTSNKTVDDYDLDEIKKMVNKVINVYQKQNKRKKAFDNWDGYLGGDEARRKEIMRNHKIKDLLDGNTEKLEDFLNKDN